MNCALQNIYNETWMWFLFVLLPRCKAKCGSPTLDFTIYQMCYIF